MTLYLNAPDSGERFIALSAIRRAMDEGIFNNVNEYVVRISFRSSNASTSNSTNNNTSSGNGSGSSSTPPDQVERTGGSRGLPIWVWVLIGIGALVLLLVLLFILRLLGLLGGRRQRPIEKRDAGIRLEEQDEEKFDDSYEPPGKRSNINSVNESESRSEDDDRSSEYSEEEFSESEDDSEEDEDPKRRRR
jgi:hypothetical protein